jgi:hypothetical protein
VFVLESWYTPSLFSGSLNRPLRGTCGENPECESIPVAKLRKQKCVAKPGYLLHLSGAALGCSCLDSRGLWWTCSV